MSDMERDPADVAANAAMHLNAPATIVCVDCGGTCHLLSRPSEGDDGHIGFRPGDIVSYRCSDCRDRWDVELDGSDV